jgi:hypothetical protein
MRISSPSSDRVLSIYLALNQFPILKQRIRARMRRELFQWGIIQPEMFEAEVRKRAIESQSREGLQDPYAEESYETWELRLFRIRESLTDFYFAHNFLYEDFEGIVKEIVGERGSVPDIISFNPELAPQDMLFEQAEMIDRLPREKSQHLMARLQEIKAVLIRTMISDQLTYLNIARKWFTISDLKDIKRRTIGYGKIGGKSAGMILAYRILSEVASPEIKEAIQIPVSYFLASDMFYTFMTINGLTHWSDQKYKPEAQIRAEYEMIEQEFIHGAFPEDILEQLQSILHEAGRQPIIVRSSSLLEDNLGMSFAGKYESYFCPNQGTHEENLKALTEAIARVYASCFNPDALLYRHHKGLIEYDERIAILIQHVQGEQYGDYFMPQGSGVGFSRNLYRWSPQIRREDGFLRLVWGLGTRAVNQLGDDYPRLVALSHPLLHPAAETKMIKRFSQHYVDLIDLKENTVKTLPAKDVLNPRYPPIRYIAQVDQGDYLTAMHTSMVNPEEMVITFEEMLRRTNFPKYMRTILQTLQEHYRGPVDMEFTVQVLNPHSARPNVKISLLQCRHQSAMNEEGGAIPDDLQEKDIIFSTRRLVPHGVVRGIPYVVFVSPEGYFSLRTQAMRNKLERAIGALNVALKGQIFICVGPGRWGTSTPDLGVHVGYGDIYSTYALVELSGKEIGPDPEPSFGTHFFQDLMEARIFPLAVNLDDKEAIFNRNFFYKTPNRLTEKIPCTENAILNCLRLIYVNDFRPGYLMDLIMDDDQSTAVAFLAKQK